MSGWSTCTIDGNSIGSDRTEEVKGLLKDIAEENDGIVSIDDFSIGEFGYHSHLEELISRLLKEGERFLIIDANDTTDSGEGFLYEKSKNSREMIDRKCGYEGAVAADVVGYFREEYDINGHPRI